MERPGHLRHIKTSCRRCFRKSISWHRGCNDVEVLSKQRKHLVPLEHAARPTVACNRKGCGEEVGGKVCVCKRGVVWLFSAVRTRTPMVEPSSNFEMRPMQVQSITYTTTRLVHPHSKMARE
jgi:hypothetical protein